MTTTAMPRGAAALPAVRRRRLDPLLLAVLALAGVLTLWGLSRSGYSNEYYAAAARAGSESWTAWFFGSLDPGSFITVDKPPLSLWLMGLSARALGFSSFSILLPQALCTIAAVALLFATVKRLFRRPAALLAAAFLALTPVTVAIGRVNNPDALLVLLMVGAAYLLVRALESGRTKHLLWCGALVGLAFMTKMLQGWMLLPALSAAYALAGPPRLAVRLRQLLAAGAVTVAVSASWPLAVTLWPGDKPFVGGSEDGGVWNLILGYNGLGRILGEGGGMGGGGGMFGGTPGLWRMLNEQVGGQVAWLLPLALVSLGAGLWLTRGEPRTGLRRAGWVLFGAWALVLGLVFSFAQGIFHPYYVSALAPAIAVLSGAGLVALWGWAADSWAGVAALAAALLATAYVAVALLARTPEFAPWLSTAIPVAAAVGAFGVVARRVPGLLGRRALAVAAVAGVLAMTAGPAAYSVATAGRA
ncbi:MAG: glycosyltransferase family 39 protein, partial [Solirubrobacteraceae bacterium]